MLLHHLIVTAGLGVLSSFLVFRDEEVGAEGVTCCTDTPGLWASSLGRSNPCSLSRRLGVLVLGPGWGGRPPGHVCMSDQHSLTPGLRALSSASRTRIFAVRQDPDPSDIGMTSGIFNKTVSNLESVQPLLFSLFCVGCKGEEDPALEGVSAKCEASLGCLHFVACVFVNCPVGDRASGSVPWDPRVGSGGLTGFSAPCSSVWVRLGHTLEYPDLSLWVDALRMHNPRGLFYWTLA